MYSFSASRLFKEHLEQSISVGFLQPPPAPVAVAAVAAAEVVFAGGDQPTSTWALRRPGAVQPHEVAPCGLLQRLPPELLRLTLSFLPYDTIAQIRTACKWMDEMCRDLLNQGFSQLGSLIERAKAELKKELPKRESQRRSHRLCRVNEAYAALDTRYALLSMTYRKYIDYGVCCFIPGKVLDEGFTILRRLSAVRTATGAQMNWDLTELLRDLRDLSRFLLVLSRKVFSMAMEYFEESTQPFLRNPFDILNDEVASRPRRTFISPLPSSASESVSQRRKGAARLIANATSRYIPIDPQSKEWKKSIEEKLEETQDLVKKQGVMIHSQKLLISRLVTVCNNMSAQLGMEPLSLDDFDNSLETADAPSVPFPVLKPVPIPPSSSSSSTVIQSISPRRLRKRPAPEPKPEKSKRNRK